MKIAALYDIHGNAPALKAVLEKLNALKPDLIVLGGDLLSGPLPLATLALIEQLKHQFSVTAVLGNNDQDILDIKQGKNLNLSDNAKQQMIWTANQLNASQLNWLNQFPLTKTIGNLFFCHAVEKDNHTIFTPHNRQAQIQALFSGVSVPTIICGHTHLQFHLRLDNGQEIFNAGSVGMPFADQAGAQWLWIDGDTFQFKQTPIDQNATSECIAKSQFPFVNQFIDQHVYHTVSVKNGYQLLDSLTKR